MASIPMVESVPSSIVLSPAQREMLDLIIQDQASIQGPAEPEHVILLWSEGISESATAEKLGISEAEVRPSVIAGGHRRHALQPRRRSCTKHSTISFHSFSESQTKNSFRDRIKLLSRRRSIERANKGNQQNTKNYELRHERLLKSFTTNQRSTGSTEATGP